MQMLIQYCFVCLRSSAYLMVKGPSEPVLEGQDVSLECVDTDSKMNMSSVHFERFSKVRPFTQKLFLYTILYTIKLQLDTDFS